MVRAERRGRESGLLGALGAASLGALSLGAFAGGAAAIGALAIECVRAGG
jgi:hypothetical protein